MKRFFAFMVTGVIVGLLFYGINPPVGIQGWCLYSGLVLFASVITAVTMPDDFSL